MDHRQLEFFLMVCKERSISRAAEQLFISQQALSKSMSNLEQELGISLFTRMPHGIRLTPAGEHLSQRAIMHLETRDEIVREMQQYRSGPQIRIGFFMGLLQALPPHFFARFMDEHPDVELRFYSYNDTEQCRIYQNYSCDIVITSSPLVSASFVEQLRLDSPIGILLHESHPLAAQESICTADLARYPLFTLNTESETQTRLSAYLRSWHITPASVLGDADGDLQMDLLQRGYISFYAGKHSALAEGYQFRMLSDMNLRWEMYVYSKRGHHLTAVENTLIHDICSHVTPD